jgi:co-chaperonin GroES (HSP10)
MRNEIFVDKIGKPVMNNVIVEVVDTFDSFISKGGIKLVNAADKESWGDNTGYNITEFIVRYGTVVRLPKGIYPGSFDYATECELQVGDVVYWNSISFKEHLPMICEDKKYLLVDYHEILLRIRDGEMTPINGNVLLHAIQKEETALSYTKVYEKTEKWKIYKKPEKKNIELSPRNEFTDIWEVGDTVYILVMDKPYRIEGYINRNLDEVVYACPLRMILCAV